jgi:outer membrane lipoprotein-sorting protein
MKKAATIALAVGVLVTGAAFAPALTGVQIATKAELADNGWGSSSNVLTMTLTNRNGQQTTRKMHGYSLEVEADGDMSMTVFDSPADVKGTASMTYTHKSGDDDQWLYLPAISRVKRISSSNKSGPFMGSEFAFEDLSSQEVEKYTYKYISEENVNNESCYKVERYPVSKTSGYKRNVVWYNKSNFRAEKIEFYDRKNALLKTLSYSDYKQYEGKYWRPSSMFMENHQNGKKTKLQFSEQKFNVELTAEDFSQNSLKRAK